MKTIDELIIETYNNEQKDKIKTQIDAKPIDEFKIIEVKTRTKFFIPSLISLFAAVIILIISSTLFFVIPTPQTAPFLSSTERHLKETTVDYIKRPITTLVENDTNSIIAIYYGIKGDPLAEHSNYLVFEILSVENVVVETKITNGSQLIWSNRFSFENISNNYYAFETTLNDIHVNFTINQKNIELSINLANYYDFLRK